ncbi:unnamed protein product [Mytilus coruscus]|uniref:Uncharacterized protein n=1 Tax=Mytilus coruscus TaxID=42192 RepID=A0A6J8DLL7_MYTCO|nr:unnamed protein product [Mytilus coruscus]
MVDETTDVAVKKELILYVRFLKNGKSSTHFLKMIELFDGKAATIKSAIVQTLEEIDVPLEKMCALGSDGASVMLGRKGGVAALLKAVCSNIDCKPLCCSQIGFSKLCSAAVPYLKMLKAIMEQLYRFYLYSAVRMAALHHIQRKDADYTEVRPLVTETLKPIQSFKERHGDNCASGKNVIEDLIKENFKVKSLTEEEFDKFERQVIYQYNQV